MPLLFRLALRLQCLRLDAYPSRNPQQNMADLKAQIAANEKGVQELRKMVEQFSLGCAVGVLPRPHHVVVGAPVRAAPRSPRVLANHHPRWLRGDRPRRLCGAHAARAGLSQRWLRAWPRWGVHPQELLGSCGDRDVRRGTVLRSATHRPSFSRYARRWARGAA